MASKDGGRRWVNQMHELIMIRRGDRSIPDPPGPGGGRTKSIARHVIIVANRNRLLEFVAIAGLG